MKFKLLLLPLFLTAGPLVQAAVDAALSVEIRLGKTLPPPPPAVVVIKESAPKGPPPWAPAHGVRRHHVYYYYPGANIYFRPEDRIWFYLDGREWRFAACLPTNLRVDFERSVSLTMAADKPHQFHDKVQAYYPADYFGSVVRVKEKDPKPDKDKTDRADDSSPGRSDASPGKGQGKGKGKSK
ncbi:MAG: hypothetical protein Q8N18_06240 [Opitutaceae bacterium]|nr:hypothetical protein [Opitutaceae bacterium]